MRLIGQYSFVPERDESQEALRQVEKVTDSEPVKGEELVESEDLKRKFREAKKRLNATTNVRKTARSRKKQ
jgi:hypothetical protein